MHGYYEAKEPLCKLLDEVKAIHDALVDNWHNTNSDGW
jgi:hypothetical protein